MLRASSLAAVTSLVWSTRERRVSTAISRTAWRTMTMASFAATLRLSRRVVAIDAPLERRSQKLDASLHGQSRTHARKRQPELHESDGHGRPHAHDHGFRVEDPRHAGDVADRAADEGVDDLQRRDVDQNAFGVIFHD